MAVPRGLVVVGYALAASLLGCRGAEDLPPLAPVHGRVTFQGKPLPAGWVIFRPDVRQGNAAQHEARGLIDAEGNYQLSTPVGTSLRVGVVPGQYRVAVADPKELDKTAPRKHGKKPEPKSLIPLKYSNPDSSGIVVQVTEGASGDYDIELDIKGGRLRKGPPHK
jgi:hypothetical protein